MEKTKKTEDVLEQLIRDLNVAGLSPLEPQEFQAPLGRGRRVTRKEKAAFWNQFDQNKYKKRARITWAVTMVLFVLVMLADQPHWLWGILVLLGIVLTFFFAGLANEDI